MLDMLEITGSISAACRQVAMSQPTVSRRYQQLSRDLGLRCQRDAPLGLRYGDTPWLREFRAGIRSHRLSCGVLRLGTGGESTIQFEGVPWAQWVPLKGESWNDWPQLLRHGLLDGVLTTDQKGLTPKLVDLAADVVCLRRRPAVPLYLVCLRDQRVLDLAHQIRDAIQRY